MKSLIWKEWRENWWLVLMGPIVAVICVGFVSVSGVNGDHEIDSTHRLPLDFGWMAMLLPILISTMACTVQMVNPEIDRESLQLLFTLPISKSEIWKTKLNMAFYKIAVNIVLAAIIVGTWLTIEPTTHIDAIESNGASIGDFSLCALIIFLPLYFGLGSVGTMFPRQNTRVDRPKIKGLSMLALMAGIAAIWFLVEMIATRIMVVFVPGMSFQFGPGHFYMAALAAGGAVTLPLLLAVSHKVFTTADLFDPDTGYSIIAKQLPRLFAVAGVLGLVWLGVSHLIKA